MMQPLLANAGVPMIVLALPPMVVLLIPVIILEALASRKLITNENPRKIWTGITAANIFSTFLGWPVAWIVLVVIQLVTGGGGARGLDSPVDAILSVTLQAPWLIPYEADLYWMIPAALGVLLVPFFFVSVYTERFILRAMWKAEPAASTRAFSWRAHFLSYAFLFLVVICYAFYSINNAPRQQSQPRPWSGVQ